MEFDTWRQNRGISRVELCPVLCDFPSPELFLQRGTIQNEAETRIIPRESSILEKKLYNTRFKSTVGMQNLTRGNRESFENRNHLKTGLFEGRILNGRLFENQTVGLDFQMVGTFWTPFWILTFEIRTF